MPIYSQLRTCKELLLHLSYLTCQKILLHQLGCMCMNLLLKSMRFILCTKLDGYI